MTILAIDMGKAGLNTILGIGIVFCALVLISFIISCFKFIGKVGKKPDAVPAAPVNVPKVTEVPQAAPAEEDLSDDLELVAVITAAITAYEEANGGYVPEDGLVVRSIRKVNKQRWLNA